MGSGVLPTTIHNNTLYFLFGKENKFADTPGWSDFGGGTEQSESFLETASREASEESTGFLGSKEEIKKKLLKNRTYYIDIPNTRAKNVYRMYLLPIRYSEELPYYYNNNQRFLQCHLDETIIKTSKIFEKAEIQWMSVTQLLQKKPLFRSYFQPTVEILIKQQKQIMQFIQGSLAKEKKYSPTIYIMGNSMSSAKGTHSKTHPGRKNYTTKKGDKVFHRKGKYVYRSRRPYYGRKQTKRRY
uniref:Uncharacterized protein n=1 Tax=viral metagenome TaxID=1070528 RepID=A0A6C0LC75_9ZZZZ